MAPRCPAAKPAARTGQGTCHGAEAMGRRATTGHAAAAASASNAVNAQVGHGWRRLPKAEPPRSPSFKGNDLPPNLADARGYGQDSMLAPLRLAIGHDSRRESSASHCL